jgi:hypothetical protein
VRQLGIARLLHLGNLQLALSHKLGVTMAIQRAVELGRNVALLLASMALASSETRN